MRNARFWEYTPAGGLVKLTLRPGQSLHHWTGHDTEEGWSSEANRWTLEDDTVKRESVSDGRDCDGRLTQHYEAQCPVWKLRHREECDVEGYFPAWEAVDSSQCDEYAEQMNY